MSAETDAKLKELQAAVDAAKAAYDQELAYNAKAKQNKVMNLWQLPYPPYPMVSKASFDNYIIASNTQLVVKQGNLDAAKAALQTYQQSVKQNAINSVIASDPTIVEKIQDAINGSSTGSDPGKTMFTQGTTKYLLWGAIALTIIVVGVIVYKKRFAS